MCWRLGNVDDIAWSIEFAALWKGAPASLHGKARSLSQSEEGDLFERSFGPRLQALAAGKDQASTAAFGDYKVELNLIGPVAALADVLLLPVAVLPRGGVAWQRRSVASSWPARRPPQQCQIFSTAR